MMIMSGVFITGLLVSLVIGVILALTQLDWK